MYEKFDKYFEAGKVLRLAILFENFHPTRLNLVREKYVVFKNLSNDLFYSKNSRGRMLSDDLYSINDDVSDASYLFSRFVESDFVVGLGCLLHMCFVGKNLIFTMEPDAETLREYEIYVRNKNHILYLIEKSRSEYLLLKQIYLEEVQSKFDVIENVRNYKFWLELDRKCLKIIRIIFEKFKDDARRKSKKIMLDFDKLNGEFLKKTDFLSSSELQSIRSDLKCLREAYKRLPVTIESYYGCIKLERSNIGDEGKITKCLEMGLKKFNKASNGPWLYERRKRHELTKCKDFSIIKSKNKLKILKIGYESRPLCCNSMKNSRFKYIYENGKDFEKFSRDLEERCEWFDVRSVGLVDSLFELAVVSTDGFSKL